MSLLLFISLSCISDKIHHYLSAHEICNLVKQVLAKGIVFLSSETEGFKPKADARSGSGLFSITSAHRTVPYFGQLRFFNAQNFGVITVKLISAASSSLGFYGTRERTCEFYF